MKSNTADWDIFFKSKNEENLNFHPKRAPPDSKWKNYSAIYEPNDEYSPLSFPETCKHSQRVICFIKFLLGLTFVLKHTVLIFAGI